MSNGFLWSLRGPSKLEKGHSCPLGDGVAVTRESSKAWKVTHTDFTGGTYFWRHIEGLAGSMRTRTRYDVYDGEGAVKHFYKMKAVLEYTKQQALALAAAKRLGYEGGKAGLF